MSKELEEAWITIYHYNDEIIHDMGSEYIENPLKEELDIVDNALQRLKAIDNAKPSEALQGVDILYSNALDLTNENTKYLPEYLKPIRDNIKQALLKAQDLEKRLKDLNTRYMDYVDKSQETIGKLEDNLTKEEQENIKLQRALKIIKEKSVDVFRLKKLDFNTFNQLQRSCKLPELTQEEFDFLKEML